ncbi:hypothetical protein AKO1_001028 [Acrasis kona]|uniref:Uncharacterized protein n=1 Tax=Acrasis kona TaxID=1008807 RepID=A0AAW2ZCU7_9EUKA
MQQPLFIALLLLIVSVCSAEVQISARAVNFSGGDAMNFLKGFLVGASGTFGNAEKCARDYQVIMDDIHFAVDHLSSGFSSKSAGDIGRGIASLGHGAIHVALSYKDCGAEGFVKSIEKIGKDMAGGPLGLLKVVVKEAINIFSNRKDLTNEFKGLTSKWRGGDYYGSGVEAGRIVATLMKYRRSLERRALRQAQSVKAIQN